jgi:alpha-galactosidase
MLAAPLLAGNDLREMSASTREILTAPEVIAIDQDPLGRQARRVRSDGDIEVWSRPLADGAHAVVVLNRGDARARVGLRGTDLGLARVVRMRDIWARADVDVRDDAHEAMVGPHTAVMLKLWAH